MDDKRLTAALEACAAERIALNRREEVLALARDLLFRARSLGCRGEVVTLDATGLDMSIRFRDDWASSGAVGGEVAAVPPPPAAEGGRQAPAPVAPEPLPEAVEPEPVAVKADPVAVEPEPEPEATPPKRPNGTTPWTEAEEKQLIAMRAAGQPMTDIARALGRTLNATKWRANHLKVYAPKSRAKVSLPVQAPRKPAAPPALAVVARPAPEAVRSFSLSVPAPEAPPPEVTDPAAIAAHLAALPSRPGWSPGRDRRLVEAVKAEGLDRAARRLNIADLMCRRRLADLTDGGAIALDALLAAMPEPAERQAGHG